MTRRARWFVLPIILALIGCTDPTALLPDGSGPGEDTSPGGSPGDGISLTGTILSPDSAKRSPRAQSVDEDYVVVAQSDETSQIYRGTTDENGLFEVDIPDSEAGNSFMVSILGSDGRHVGPMLFDTQDDEGATGLAPTGQTNLGAIELPDDPTSDPIEPGDDADLADLVDSDLSARLDDNGVPVGLVSHGKGQDARQDAQDDDQTIDADRDGLIDLFDADDDGDGVVDDFDDSSTPAPPSDVRVNFFMNLKISGEQAAPYYTGTAAERAAALAVDTIITFEVMMEPGATRLIVSANLLETPGPTYVPTAERVFDDADGLASVIWADEDYAFIEEADRFNAFVRPNSVMDAGDTFTVEVTFDDGTTEQHSRMINYVFKNIPTLLRYGSAGSLTDFDLSSPTVNGSPEHPITFDGSLDLVLEFNPPPDETGAPITGMAYTFAVFYETEDGQQLNDNVDVDATWPEAIDGFDGGTYYVDVDDLGALSDAGTYTVTLPKEIFADTVVLDTGAAAAVHHYKIDVTAEAPTGNAAIMLAFQRQ